MYTVSLCACRCEHAYIVCIHTYIYIYICTKMHWGCGQKEGRGDKKWKGGGGGGGGSRQIDCLTKGFQDRQKSISAEELTQFVSLAVCTLVTLYRQMAFLFLDPEQKSRQLSVQQIASLRLSFSKY